VRMRSSGSGAFFYACNRIRVGHKAAAAEGLAEAAVIVRELLPLLPGGPALDLACGAGRNALLLAGRGQPVTAVDWSPAALGILEERARATGIEVRRQTGASHVISAARRGIETICIDLERAQIAQNEFALILCVNYLQRSLFGQMAEALRPGGALLFETYTVEQLAFSGGPRNPAHLLQRGELHDAFPELEIVFYRELCAGQGIATLLARRSTR
jgi:tellurite methyltransferase